MNRRHFLSSISAGAVGAAFLRFSIADERDGDKDAKARLLAADALARAKERGKPLLVLVVPDDPSRVWKRGEWFGSWLAHADEALLADLALFDLVCAPVRAFEGLSMRDLDAAKAPVMLLVETHEETPRAIAIDGELPESIEGDTAGFPRDGGIADMKKRAGAAIVKRDALLTQWFRDAVRIDEQLEALAQQAAAALTDAQRAALVDHAADPAKIEGALLLRAAAPLRHGVKSDPKLASTAAELTNATAVAAATALQQQAPAGAKWGTQSGCGFTLDEPPVEDGAMSVACGMGFVADEGKRFLYFFVQEGG